MGKFEDNLKEKAAKLPLADVHPEFECALARVLKMSMEKGYVPNNWLDDETHQDYTFINAARRHINAYLQGEIYNEEKGCDTIPQHLECAAYNCLIVATRILKRGK